MLAGGTVSLVNSKIQQKWIVWAVAFSLCAPCLSCLFDTLSEKSKVTPHFLLSAQQSQVCCVWAPSEAYLQWYGSFAGVFALSGFHLVKWIEELLHKEAQTSRCGETECILNIKCSFSNVMLPPVGNWTIWNIKQNTWNWSLFYFVYITSFPLYFIGL